MSKYTAEQVREARLRYAKTMDRDAVILDMLDAYAATLSQQAEWPSAADVRKALKAADEVIIEAIKNGSDDEDMEQEKAMRAALQSVRPPAKPDAGAVKRHRCHQFGYMVEDNEGSWVRFEDVASRAAVPDEVVASFVEQAATIISDRAFASGRALEKARRITDMALTTLLSAAPPAPEKD